MRRAPAAERGMTLLEVVVAIAVLAMVALLIAAVVQSLSRGRTAEGARSERVRQGREAVERILRDVSGAYLSTHVPSIRALMTEKTAFVGKGSSPYDRVDFTAFAHRRTERDSPDSDQAEVGYFVVPDPDALEKMDLVRREQSPIDIDPLKGGTVNVVAEDVLEFDLRFLEPQTAQWIESWDSTQVSGQPNRLPLAVSVRLSLRAVDPEAPPVTFSSKIFLPIQQPLAFGLPRQ